MHTVNVYLSFDSGVNLWPVLSSETDSNDIATCLQ